MILHIVFVFTFIAIIRMATGVTSFIISPIDIMYAMNTQPVPFVVRLLVIFSPIANISDVGFGNSPAGDICDVSPMVIICYATSPYVVSRMLCVSCMRDMSIICVSILRIISLYI